MSQCGEEGRGRGRVERRVFREVQQSRRQLRVEIREIRVPSSSKGQLAHGGATHSAINTCDRWIAPSLFSDFHDALPTIPILNFRSPFLVALPRKENEGTDRALLRITIEAAAMAIARVGEGRGGGTHTQRAQIGRKKPHFHGNSKPAFRPSM
jgi:hypothetical protein